MENNSDEEQSNVIPFPTKQLAKECDDELDLLELSQKYNGIASRLTGQ